MPSFFYITLTKFVLLAGNITLIKNFLDYLIIEKRYSAHTTVSYENDLNQFNLYLSNFYSGIEFDKVEMFHVRSYMVHLLESKLAKSTVARKVSSIKSLYKFLKKPLHKTYF